MKLKHERSMLVMKLSFARFIGFIFYAIYRTEKSALQVHINLLQ
jgi:hypothetical protein